MPTLSKTSEHKTVTAATKLDQLPVVAVPPKPTVVSDCHAHCTHDRHEESGTIESSSARPIRKKSSAVRRMRKP